MYKHYQLKSIYDFLVGWQWPDDNYNETIFSVKIMYNVMNIQSVNKSTLGKNN